jgi:sugar phosphate isomerase/epimerase
MKLSVNTSYQAKEGDAEACLRRIAEAGFSSIQWIHDWNNDYMYSESEMDRIVFWLNKYGLTMGDLHASSGVRKQYASFDEYVRKAGVELIKNRVDLAARCGAKAIVLHMEIPVAFWNSPTLDRLYGQVFKSFDELKPYCLDRGVKIAVENLVRTDFDKEVRQFTTLFERYEADFLGLCYDSGHANCAFKNAGESVRFLELFIDRLASVHLTDNDGSGDLHWVPFTGTVNWNAIAKLIAQSGYRGYISLESVIWRSGLEDEQVYLAECYRRAVEFERLLEQYRK